MKEIRAADAKEVAQWMGAEETTATRISYFQRDLWARFHLIGGLPDSFSLHQVSPGLAPHWF